LSFNEGTIYVESIKNAGGSRLIGERIVIYYSMVDDTSYNFIVSGLDDSDDEFAINFDNGPDPTNNVKADLCDLIGSSDGSDSSGSYVFTIAGVSISGAYKIDLFDEDNSNELFGRIWVFDTGSFIYELNTGQGTYHASLENGAVLNGHPTSSNIDRKPVVFYENNNLVIYILQINTTNNVGIGGSAGEDRSVSYNFKMQFFNDDFESDTDAWKVFYQIYYDFVDSGSDDIQFDNADSLEFTLVRSVCDIRLEV